MRKSMKISMLFVVLFLSGTMKLWAQQVRTLAPFDELSVIGNIEVVLEEGEEEKAVIYTKNIDENDVSISVKGDVLKIRLYKTVFKNNEDVKIEITYRKLRIVKGSAGAHVYNNSTLEGDKIIARAHSGAKVDLSVNVDALDGAAYEGAELKVRGKTESQEVVAATGGQYKALNLDSNRTIVKANTGGEAEVVANDKIEASANTGGRIGYKGDPNNENTRSKIAGNIYKI